MNNVTTSFTKFSKHRDITIEPVPVPGPTPDEIIMNESMERTRASMIEELLHILPETALLQMSDEELSALYDKEFSGTEQLDLDSITTDIFDLSLALHNDGLDIEQKKEYATRIAILCTKYVNLLEK